MPYRTPPPAPASTPCLRRWAILQWVDVLPESIWAQGGNPYRVERMLGLTPEEKAAGEHLARERRGWCAYEGREPCAAFDPTICRPMGAQALRGAR